MQVHSRDTFYRLLTRKCHLLIVLWLVFPVVAVAQAFSNSTSVTSPEVSGDRHITFRIMAPHADSVKLNSPDIPDSMFGSMMTRGDDGIWEITVGPVPAGAYRYNFEVDGISVIDPRNPSTSESNENTWSLVVVPGNSMMDTNNIPHGAVSEIHYYSETLGKFRRMHVYTPPGYQAGGDRYPVFYLLHGAFDSDDSWSTVGRAGFILDNLIAEGEARPMIVVMPDGHTGPFSFGDGLPVNEFVDDFVNEIKPYIENHYRVFTDRQNRAMAGLSMGGSHTLNIAIPHLDEYAYIGVFSSGVFGLGDGPGPEANDQEPSYQEQNRKVLNNDELKEDLELFWFATGEDDFLVETTRATVKMFREHGFDVTYEETGGGHTWLNWRDYLIEFAPMLFNK